MACKGESSCDSEEEDDETCSECGSKKSKKVKYEQFEVESAMRAVLEAEKVKANRELSKLVQQELTKQLAAIKKVKGK